MMHTASNHGRTGLDLRRESANGRHAPLRHVDIVLAIFGVQ